MMFILICNQGMGAADSEVAVSRKLGKVRDMSKLYKDAYESCPVGHYWVPIQVAWLGIIFFFFLFLILPGLRVIIESKC